MPKITLTLDHDDAPAQPTKALPWDHEHFAPRGERPAPPHGFDNPADIEEAKRKCHNIAGLFQHLPRDRADLTEFAFQLHAQGISERMAVNLISEFCAIGPGIAKPDIALIVDHAYSVVVTPPGGKSLAGVRTWQDRWPVVEGEEHFIWPRPLIYDLQGKKNASQCAELFRSERPRRLISSGGQLYSLVGAVWQAVSDQEIAAEIRATDPTHTNDVPKIQTMVKAIHLATFTHAQPFDWLERPDNAPDPNDLILFRNGIFDIATGELLPHRGQLFATALPDYDFDPDATCPIWLEKLNEWLHESYHETLQQFFGYCLTPDTRYEVLLALLGVSRGGKGTVSRVLEGIVGPQLVASRTLDDLGSSFGLHGTLDKRLIAIPDAHDVEVSKRSAALERIKSISGNDPISVDRKYHDLVSAKVPAKILLTANRPPKFIDESGALSNRTIIVKFEHSFVGREDRELRSKLLAELSGIANWSIQGLRQLREQGRFKIGGRGRLESRHLAEQQSPALRFARACLDVTGTASDFASLDDVFMVYRDWALEEGLSGRELRNKADFRADIIAALAANGVRYTRRRHATSAVYGRGRGKPRAWGLSGVALRVVPGQVDGVLDA